MTYCPSLNQAYLLGDIMYDLNRINDCLNTKIVGRTIIQYESLDSTYSKSRSIFNTCPEGTVVLSENQLKWDVRTGSRWICYPNKNIYLSIIFKPATSNLSISKFDFIGCTSLFEALNSLYDIDLKIKWPNDILIRGEKVSSISSQFVVKNTGGVIISLGINANMNKEELELNGKTPHTATSLMVETGGQIDREVLIGEVLNKFEKYYIQLIYDNSVESAIDIYNRNLIIFGKIIEVTNKGKKSRRKVYAKGIDSEGRLIVKNEKGNDEILIPGETIIKYEKNA
jgi:BirA family biotin operon repressor/biotin-[acetyl-CoA-carboxylase] ligase